MSKPFKEEHPLGKLMYHDDVSKLYVNSMHRDDVNIGWVILFDSLDIAIQL